MKPVFCSLAFLVFGAFSHAADAPYCAVRKDFLINAYSQSKNLSSIANLYANHKSILIGVGEEHFSNTAPDFYDHLLVDMNKSVAQPFCLIIEQVEFVDRTGKIHAEPINELMKTDLTPEQREECDSGDDCRSLRAYQTLVDGLQWPIDRALQLGIPIYAVDDPDIARWSDKHINANYYQWLNGRDAHMAKRIEDLFASHVCNSALLINGSAHYMAEGENRKPLSQLLRDTDIPSHFAYFVDPTFENSDVWFWHTRDPIYGKEAICSEEPGFGGRNVWVPLAVTPEDVPISYKQDGFKYELTPNYSGRWSDFDSLIIYGCNGPFDKTCTKLAGYL